MSAACVLVYAPDPHLAGIAPDAGAHDTVVLKFGSSVLGTPNDTASLASEIYARVRQGRRVVAVVSAFAGETDRLLAQAASLGLAHDNPWLPACVAQGEERSAVLAAVACDRIGLDVSVLTVRQLGIQGEGPDCRLNPVGLDGAALRAALAAHDVVIVPGFGALCPDGRVGLLGRGGSDMTAAFLAAELGLSRVTLVKDVDGLYDRDPAADAGGARRFSHASWAAARAVGTRLIQHQAIDLAESRDLEIEIVAPGAPAGTIIGRRGDSPVAPARRRATRVALAGCGVVGGGVLERVLRDPRYELTGVLVRDSGKPRERRIPESLITTDAAALLGARPDILLEALSDAAGGESMIRSALTHGIHVVSANKQAICRDPAGLNALAASTGARLAYSAAVGGGTPMIETVRRARQAGPVLGFDGVLNGTVNFILHELGEGSDFPAALRAARHAGFAEEDATADLEGLDAAAKLRILAHEAFGEAPGLEGIGREGLDGTRDLNGRRQVSTCRASGSGVHGEIVYRDVSGDPDLGGLTHERNALRVIGQDGRIWTCKGRGAGRWPTVEAMMADLVDVSAAAPGRRGVR